MDLSAVFPAGIWHYLLGGLMIGAGVSVLFIFTGRIGGMSGVFSSTWSYVSQSPFFRQANLVSSRAWRLQYAFGLIVGAALWMVLTQNGPVSTEIPWWQLALGGFIGGYGARLGNGCTSGHGICGLASLSATSLWAVLVFLGCAIVTAQLVAALGGA